MIDIEKFIKDDWGSRAGGKNIPSSASLDFKIFEITKEHGELTIGVLLNRLRNTPKSEVLAELQRMHDRGVVEVFQRSLRRKTLVIRVADKA